KKRRIVYSSRRTALEAHSVQRGASEHVSWKEMKHKLGVHPLAEFFTTASRGVSIRTGRGVRDLKVQTPFTILLCFHFQGTRGEGRCWKPACIGSSVTLCGSP